MKSYLFLLVFLAFNLLACSPFRASEQAILSSTLRANPELQIEHELQMTAGQLVDNCREDDRFERCLIWKNPVAQNRETLFGFLEVDDDASDFTNFGVNLRGLTSQSSLENSSLQVLDNRGVTIDPRQYSKRDVESYRVENLTPFMAYYWAQRTLEVLQIRTGINYLQDEQIKIYVNDSVTGWAPQKKQIQLGFSKRDMPLALSGEVVAYFVSLASVSVATDYRVDDLGQDSMHRDCNLQSGITTKNGCCVNEKGCLRAIVSGLAEYQAALVFPESASLGESIENSLEGQKRCGLARNLDSLQELSAQRVFSSCPQESQGDVFLMGSFFAAQLWEIRQDLSGTQNQYLMDKLVIQSLSELSNDETFLSFFEKLKRLDKKRAYNIL